MIKNPLNVSERIIILCFHTSEGTDTVVSTYAPTLYSSGKVKDKFYKELFSVIGKIPNTEHL